MYDGENTIPQKSSQEKEDRQSRIEAAIDRLALVLQKEGVSEAELRKYYPEIVKKMEEREITEREEGEKEGLYDEPSKEMSSFEKNISAKINDNKKAWDKIRDEVVQKEEAETGIGDEDEMILEMSQSYNKNVNALIDYLTEQDYLNNPQKDETWLKEKLINLKYTIPPMTETYAARLEQLNQAAPGHLRSLAENFMNRVDNILRELKQLKQENPTLYYQGFTERKEPKSGKEIKVGFPSVTKFLEISREKITDTYKKLKEEQITKQKNRSGEKQNV